MQQSITTDRLAEMRGQTVYDASGEKIGKVEEIFYDNETQQPVWIGIGTGFLGTKRVLVPVQGASATDDGLTVAYDKAMVKDAPDIDSDEISADTELELDRYYGLESYAAAGSGQQAPASYGAGDRDRQTGLENVDERSVTRSEEDLRVGKRSVEAGTARLRKWVETEPVQTDINLQRETVHVNREPVDEVVSGAEIGEQTIEVPLRDEEAVVEKRVVAKERISLDKDVDERTETISDELRKERVDIEGTDADAGRRGR
jgi:uncharacterized protein (TIGR02271 family)